MLPSHIPPMAPAGYGQVQALKQSSRGLEGMSELIEPQCFSPPSPSKSSSTPYNPQRLPSLAMLKLKGSGQGTHLDLKGGL